MLPESFWGRIGYLLQQYGVSFLQGAGNTMLIAIVGTFLGCVIGFAVGVVQTIPVDKNDGKGKKILVGILKFIMACYVHVVCCLFHCINQYRRLHGRNRARRYPFCR